MNKIDICKLTKKLEKVNTKLLSKNFHPNDMIGKKIMTFGTFDLFHIGHKKIIDHAIKITGEEKNVVVGVSSDAWNFKKGKKAFQNQEKRKQQVSEQYPDIFVILEDHNKPEETWPKLFDDYDIDCIVMGEDHYKNLSYINEQRTPKGKIMKIIFFERTPKISSSILRNNKNNEKK